jgi:Holliday junction resolvase-like predicted endonuclease
MGSILDLEAFSESLDWRQFEGLAERAFESFGYHTAKNFRIKKPRMEIDLLASSEKVAFAVDCKHWKRTVGHSGMLALAEKQVKRCRALVRMSQVKRVIPVILTWHDESVTILENGVAIVPVHKISDFILNWDCSDKIKIIQKRRSKKALKYQQLF